MPDELAHSFVRSVVWIVVGLLGVVLVIGLSWVAGAIVDSRRGVSVQAQWRRTMPKNVWLSAALVIAVGLALGTLVLFVASLRLTSWYLLE